MTTTAREDALLAADRAGPYRPAGSGMATRRELRRVRLVWALLVLNVLPFYGEMDRLVPIPGIVGTMITQSALLAAFVVALTVNRPAAVRPSLFLLLLLLLPVQAVLISVQAEFLFGAVFRAGRLALFVAVLWLLTPWWYRRDLLLARTHLTVLWVVLGTILLGALLAPDLALAEGRLAGVIWPVPWTQAAHYAAVAAGISTVLWLAGRLRREIAIVSVAVSVTMLLLTHTRTAVVALLAGVVVAGLSMFVARARVRRAFAVGTVAVTVAALTVSSVIVTWLARGQNVEEVGRLTGRTKVWEAVLDHPRTALETAFGFGLSNKSFNGLPIDSNWLATYQDLGIVGVVVNAVLVVVVFAAALLRPRSPQRALALFLVTYGLVASFTETGLSDASTYLLELALAASLVLAPTSRRGGLS